MLNFQSYEISRKWYWIGIASLLCWFCVFGYFEVQEPECFGHMRCFDYDRRERELFRWDFWDNFVDNFSIRYSASMLILALSRDVLGNPKILAFASSLLFSVMVLLVARQLTKNRLYSFIPFVLMICDPIFVKYSASITYSSFWATGFMFSFWVLLKAKSLSFLPFMASCGLKVLNILYFPILVIFADGKTRNILLFSMGGLIMAGVVFAHITDNLRGIIQPSLNHFLYGLGMWSVDLKESPIVLGAVFFVLFCYIILAKHKVRYSKEMLATLVFLLINPALSIALTSWTIEPYRFLVMIGFVYIGIGFCVRKIDVVMLDLKSKFAKK
jgi:hypothetical protein